MDGGWLRTLKATEEWFQKTTSRQLLSEGLTVNVNLNKPLCRPCKKTVNIKEQLIMVGAEAAISFQSQTCTCRFFHISYFLYFYQTKHNQQKLNKITNYFQIGSGVDDEDDDEEDDDNDDGIEEEEEEQEGEELTDDRDKKRFSFVTYSIFQDD